MSSLPGKKEDKKEALKGLIKRLHEGANPEEIKEKFKKVIKDTTSTIEAVETPTFISEAEGMVPFETGTLSKEETETIFNTLPVDITFIDKEDAVRYFSQSKERIFPRTKAVIGRKVQQCHPQKSLHIVNQILEDFKSGQRDVASFWINLKDRLIYIRYFAVQDKNGDYFGCLEGTQDITDIKIIEGEKRLL